MMIAAVFRVPHLNVPTNESETCLMTRKARADSRLVAYPNSQPSHLADGAREEELSFSFHLSAKLRMSLS